MIQAHQEHGQGQRISKRKEWRLQKGQVWWCLALTLVLGDTGRKTVRLRTA